MPDFYWSEERILAEVIAPGDSGVCPTNGLPGFYLVNIGAYKRYVDGQELYDRVLAYALKGIRFAGSLSKRIMLLSNYAPGILRFLLHYWAAMKVWRGSVEA